MHAAIVTFGSSVGQASWSGHLALHGVGDSVDWQVGDLPYTREQRGADLLLLLLLLLLLWPCTESETPWTGRSETCPTPRQNELLPCPIPHLTSGAIWSIIALPNWGRTGFDLVDTPEAACRGRFVGLVNPRTKH